MSGDWENVELGDVANVRSGYAFKSTDWTDVGIPVVKIANVKSGRLEMLGCSHVDEETAARAGDFQLSAGDVLIAMTGYIGEVARVRDVDLPCVLNQRVGKFDVRDHERLDSNYLFAVLTSREMRETIESLGYGSAQPNVSPSLIHEVEFPLPPLPEQRRIAKILGDLDDKIELNRTMNETLEQMARALFKSWFVDFDPVRAKMEGRTPTGMDAATAALFPDRLVDSELGMIPEGWEVKSLDEVAHFLNGLALQKYQPGDGPTLPVIKIAQLRKGDSTGADRCSADIPPDYIVRDGDVLFSWSGSLEVDLWCGGDGALNQHLFKVTSSETPKWFCYQWLRHHLPEFREIATDKATTMGHIQRRHLTEALVLVPGAALVAAMTNSMQPIHDQLINNNIQSRTLSTLRDTLLPKLVGGEMRVGEEGI